MGNIDPKTARQVWQRVTAPAGPSDHRDLQGLILGAMETAALYRGLIAALQGKPRDLARELLEGQQETVHVLLGLRALSQGQSPGPRMPEGPNLPPVKLLNLAFRRSRNALTEYTARTIDPEFGPVFRVLAGREEGQGTAIAALLGELPMGGRH